MEPTLEQVHLTLILIDTIGSLFAALIAWLAYKKSSHDSGVGALRAELDKLRESGVFIAVAEIVSAVSAASPWLVLTDIGVRDAAGYTLAQFCRVARIVDSGVAWRSVLLAPEYVALQKLLTACGPLVWIIRLTPLELEGKARFYTENKTIAAAEIYNAMSVRCTRSPR